MQVTVSFEVVVGSAELALSDREHGTTSKTIRSDSHSPCHVVSFPCSILPYYSLEYPNTSKDTLEADQHSKVIMEFTLLNKETKKLVLVHQVSISAHHFRVPL